MNVVLSVMAGGIACEILIFVFSFTPDQAPYVGKKIKFTAVFKAWEPDSFNRF